MEKKEEAINVLTVFFFWSENGRNFIKRQYKHVQVSLDKTLVLGVNQQARQHCDVPRKVKLAKHVK